MVSYDNTYDIVNGFDSLDNTLENGIYTNTTVKECQQKCNDNQNCSGFVFDTSNNVGELKTKIFPIATREPNNNKNIYSRKMKVTNADSCSKKIVGVDSVLWNSYPTGPYKMTAATKCGISKELENEQDKVNQLKGELNNVSVKITKIVNKMTKMNIDINQKMGLNNKSLDDYISKYEVTQKQIKSDLTVDQVNRNAILQDKNIYVLEENYKYMLWSTLAIAGVVLTMNVVRSF
jgi:hypothetical protein